MEDITQYLADLRAYYPEGRKVHRLLGAIIVDLKAGAARDKTLADCEALQAEHPGSTVAKAIERVKAAFG